MDGYMDGNINRIFMISIYFSFWYMTLIKHCNPLEIYINIKHNFKNGAARKL